MCDCNKNNCILRSEKTYRSYENTQHMIEEAKHDTCDCCVKTFSDYRSMESSAEKITFTINPFKSKCQQVKRIIRLTSVARKLSDANSNIFMLHGKLEKAFDKETVTNLRLKQMVKKNLHEISILEKELKISRLSEKETRHGMKKEIKMLRKMVAGMTMNADEDDSDDDSDDSEPEPVKLKPLVKIEPKPKPVNNIIYRYQKIKNYMLSKNISLGSMVRFQHDKDELINTFFDLKYKRNELAHPKTDTFNNDEQFCNALR